MSDKILVTGVTGNVGKEVINQLMAKDLPVRAAARNLDKAESADLKEAEIVLFDYDRLETLEPALTGIGHLFVVPPPVNPRQHELIIPMIDMAVQTGVRHIVNLSAMGAENNEALPLRIAERHIENSGIAYTLLRPNWFMQNCNGFMLGGIREQGGIYVPAGEAKTSFIDIRDIAAAAVEALSTEKHLNRAYTLTGGKALNHYEMAKILSDVTGKNIQYFPMSEEDMRGALQSAGWTDESIEMSIDLYRSVRQGGTEYVSPDVATILGREPITFEQYAHDYAESWS